MKRSRASLACVMTAALVAGCDSMTGTSPLGPSIHLSASQAAVLVTRVAQIAPVHPELSWLGDSVSLVLTSGAEADRIDIATDLASGPFYAVGLQRAISTPTNSFSTFTLIAFDDPNNPTNFIIVDGYAPGTGLTPPTSVSGSFGTQTVSGHLFHVAGSTVSEWRAETGSASFSTGSSGGACLAFHATTGVTCAGSALQGTFTITVARHDAGVQPLDTRTATLQSVGVAGVLLRMQF